MRDPIFHNRQDAGLQLAADLARFRDDDPLVLALPRGGVPVAFEIACALEAELELLLVRKLGAPDYPEYGIGAVVDGADPQLVLNENVVREIAPSARYIEEEYRRQLAEIERRRQAYLGGRPPISAAGRTVIVVDDGIATGGTVRAALQALGKTGPAWLVLAVPLAPAEVIESLVDECDEIVCLAMPDPFNAVGAHYADFTQTSDEEVVALLRRSAVFAHGLSTPAP